MRIVKFMSQILSRFDFGRTDFTLAMLICLLAIWLIVLGCTIFSILSQPLSPRQRWIWIAAVAAVPVFGLAVYLPFSFCNQNGVGLFALFSRHPIRKKT